MVGAAQLVVGGGCSSSSSNQCQVEQNGGLQDVHRRHNPPLPRKNQPVLPLMRYLDWTSCAFPVWISAALNASTISFSPSTESFCINRNRQIHRNCQFTWFESSRKTHQIKPSKAIQSTSLINQSTSKSIQSINQKVSVVLNCDNALSTSWCKIEATERQCYKECFTVYI